MTITIDATYEDGVLKPAQPLPFSEHAQVRVTVEPHLAADTKTTGADDHRAGLSLAERLIAIGNSLPEEVLARLPRDGASQHDHYIYGTPKRTDLPDPE
jgi:predicted DNA-binding antitoxin AbrB/MazE fold protein